MADYRASSGFAGPADSLDMLFPSKYQPERPAEQLLGVLRVAPPTQSLAAKLHTVWTEPSLVCQTLEQSALEHAHTTRKPAEWFEFVASSSASTIPGS